MGSGVRLATILVGAILAVAFWGSTAQAGPLKTIGKAQVYAHETWPDEFSGLWLDFDYPRGNRDDDEKGLPSDQKVFIGFTSGAEEKVAELRQKFPVANPYVPVTQAHSMNALEEFQLQVTNDLRSYVKGELAIPGPSFKWYETSVWVVDNQVEVSLSKVTPGYLGWAADRYGAMFSALNIYVGQPLMSDSGGPCTKACLKKKARKKALTKKCRRAARVAKRTGSKKAKKVARSEKCRAVLR